MTNPKVQDPKVRQFPQSRARPPGSAATFKALGVGNLARQLDMPLGQTNGHWCSRCRGIWYGTFLEVCCPVCGNRQG
ncbi:MAG TPA: hypothetical protein VN821_07010 [Candidatus Udaeobacter sp.]|nr:hypothetical protein [Candidatus Udaeobacter sp.]